MKWLLSNLHSNFDGPQFLVLYSVIAAAVVALATWLSRRDGSLHLAPYLAPHKPDPYAIAYLRGGELEVIRLAILELTCLDFLTSDPGRNGAEARIRSKIAPKHADRLSPLLREVFATFASPLTFEDVDQSSLPARVRPYCQVFESQVSAEQLLRTRAENRRSVYITWSATAILLALGGVRLAAELAAGQTYVGILVLLILLPLPVLVMCCQPIRLSRRGSCYLASLQDAFQKQRLEPSRADSSEGMMLRVGLFGTSKLTNTSLARLEPMFRSRYATATGYSHRTRADAYSRNR